MTLRHQLIFLECQNHEIRVISPGSKDSQLLLNTGKKYPDGICLDSRAGHIYWTNMGEDASGADFFSNDGTIEQCNLDGTHSNTIVAAGHVVTPKQIVNDESGWLYFCDREGMRVMRVRYDGSDLETLVKRGNWPDDMEDKDRHCVGITLDKSRNNIIWTQKGFPKAGHGRIFRAPVDIVPGENPAGRSDIELLAGGLPEPIDLYYSEMSGKLFWTDRGQPPSGNTLNVADVTDEGLANHRIICVGLEDGIGLAVDEKNDACYVTDVGGFLRKVELSTGKSEILYKSGMLTGIEIVP